MANSLRNAAQQVLEAEAAAARSLLDAVVAFESKLSEIADKLDFPDGYPSECRRIITELRSTTSYRTKTELPNLIQRLTPAPVEPS